MKKIIFCTFIVLFVLNLSWTYNSKKGEGEQRHLNASQERGFDVFFSKLIGKDVVIAIVDLDITISGTVIIAYKDGVIIKSVLKQTFFIPRKSIAYVKTKESAEKIIEEEELEEEESNE